MATIVLSAAGAAIGGSIGGTVLGLSMTAVGRFAGGIIGRSIDQRLMGQGSDVVETGRVNRLRLTGSGEGDAVAQVFGRMRLAGQVIWATEFKESVEKSGGSGKGVARPAQPKTRHYSYSVSLAIALCEGEITDVGRIWADGTEIARDSLTLRVYRGTRDQLPDPKMEAVEGAGQVPAYRGTAYVVIEDLALEAFGNRVPQFTFEVARPSQPGQPGAEHEPAQGIRAVAMMPGSGEYALATTPVKMKFGVGRTDLVNVNTPSGKADFETALDGLTGELPNCAATSLIVSWFGDDLRCGSCEIRPRVEQAEFDAANMPWQVSGLDRSTAGAVARDAADRPVYGGTPADASVVEAIAALGAAGQAVTYYPFILMDQTEGNALPDPYGDGESQPVLPWRGRITLSEAPGRAGSPDGTSAAEAEVAAFFGTASAADFALGADEETATLIGEEQMPFPLSGTTRRISPVIYSGPDEWGYRRFILHQAALCKAAGGVDAFCIGSEMRGLTQIRGQNNSFPAVQAMIDLAAEVRVLLGPEVRIGYAADWSEYFGYQPADGSGDRYFHLDPLWADDNIDFIGIDNYMPLSDWREGRDHADASWGSIYDLEYLKSNIEGGEGYEWYYHSSEARAAQIRTPITDDAHGEPWIWRYKDIRGWWENQHHERIGGERQALPTTWEPRSKPVWFTELGCAAVDKGTNQPNKFLDPKSSESSLPRFSTGRRDEFIQIQYLRAMTEYWSDPGNNPVSPEYSAPMVDMSRAHVWAWDARPYPFFPNNQALWSDGANHAHGHWVTGRVSSRPLSSVVGEICARSGVSSFDTSGLYGVVRGYTVEHVADARAALQPLMLRYGFDAVERDGTLRFVMRDGEPDYIIDTDALVRDAEMTGIIEQTRASDGEAVGRVRLRFVEAGSDYQVAAEEAILPDEETHAVSTSEIPLAMTRAEGRQTVERWLSELRVASDTLRLTVPPSRLEIGAGDVISLPEDGGNGLFRVDRAEQGVAEQRLEAVRIEPETYRPVDYEGDESSVRPFASPVPVFGMFMDLPLMTGEEVPHAPHLAVTGDPWPGSAALYASDIDADYRLNLVIPARARIGVTRGALARATPGLIDHGSPLLIEMIAGELHSVDEASLLAGANLCAIGDGSPGNWEVLQFRDAQLADTDAYLVSYRLRGQLGTDAQAPAVWPTGSYVVMLDGLAPQIEMSAAQRGLARHYRLGPAERPYDDPSYQQALVAFEGIGLRPYSPCHLRAVSGSSGDVEISWIRRTRIDGDRWDTPEVPLGEETEQYLVRIVRDTAVLRETIVGDARWTYSAAMKSADGGGAFEVHVAQVSAQFGPGSFARLEVAA